MKYIVLYAQQNNKSWFHHWWTVTNSTLESRFCHFVKFCHFYWEQNVTYFNMNICTLIDYNIIYVFIFFWNFVKLWNQKFWCLKKKNETGLYVTRATFEVSHGPCSKSTGTSNAERQTNEILKFFSWTLHLAAKLDRLSFSYLAW
jgi:hypothetical protein